jgi:hypothetical protein
MQQATKFEFVINLKAARQIGLSDDSGPRARASESGKVIAENETAIPGLT